MRIEDSRFPTPNAPFVSADAPLLPPGFPSLRVAVDGRSLQKQRTGVGTYTANLLEQMLLVDRTLEVLLYSEDEIPRPAWQEVERLHSVRCRAVINNNLLWSNIAVPKMLRRQRIDLFHSPGYTLPLRLSIPAVVSIHDVSYEAEPRWYPYNRGVLRRTWYRASALRADRIITISEFSKREIVRVYGVSPEKVRLIYPGVDRRLFRRIEQKDAIEDLRARYHVSGDFFVFVGDIHARRNVERLIEAFVSLGQGRRGDAKPALLLIGRILDSSLRPMLSGMQSDSGLVRLLGYVPESDLPLFYSAAKGFVFPSFYEGFGLGVLEAMACGCPVIVARETACSEAAGDAAIVVDPWSSKSIAEAVAALIANSDLASARAAAALKRAEQFSWREAAAETLELYRQIARQCI